MKRVLILLGVLLFIGSNLWGQQLQISGTVTSAVDGNTLPGVTVLVQGTSVGTVTDIDGRYEISAPADAVLVFTFVGMHTKEVAVDGRQEINVAMESELVGLEEVIVVAYGTQRRETFTGSAATVGSEQIERIPVTSIEQALEGAAAGVQIGTLSGQPGSFVQMRIRGVGSISSSNEPLYVIDGIPVTGGSMTQNPSGSSSALASLNPSDIESVSILKDAAAASLYGSRAANGVVLITTKSGQAGETRFRVRSSVGFNDFAVPYYEVASQEQNHTLKREGFVNHALYYQGLDANDADEYATQQMDLRFPDYDPNRPFADYDWEGELFRTGVQQTHEFSATGGTEATQYFTSFSYMQQDGYSIRNDYERFTGRLNLDHQANEYIEFGVNTSISISDQNVIPDRAFYFVNPVFARQQYLSPLFPIWDVDGEYNQNIGGGQYPNLVRDLPLNKQTTQVFRSMNKGYAQVNLTEGLSLRSTVGLDALLQNEDRYWSPVSSDGETHGGYGHKRHRIFNTLTLTNIATYETSFADFHNVDLLAGFEIEDVYDEKTTADGHEYPNAILRSLAVAAEPYGASNWWDERRMMSYLSRMNYNYDNTYYLSGSFRRDGSSQLGENEMWGNFWSVSGSVRLTQLDMLQGTGDWLSDWKFRASFGTNGTLPSAWYGHLALYGYGFDYNMMPGMAITQVYNPNLRWERSENLNIGTDFTLFDRLTVDLEYYQRKTADLLLNVPVSRVSGFSTVLQNIGEMQNTGFEMTINSTNIMTEDFVWTTNLNISRNVNEILKLYEGEDIIQGAFILSEGHSFNTLYLREWAGVDPDDGMGMWYTHDEDGNRTGTTKERTEAEPQMLDATDPAFTGGIYNSFSYRNFDVSLLFNFSVGGLIYSTPHYFFNDDGMNWHSSVTKYQYENRWQQPGDETINPRYVFTNPQQTNFMSSVRVFDGDYLRLKSLNVGYTLPPRLTNQVGISGLRLFMSGRNLLTFSSVEFMDPEVDARGTYYSELPPMKTITFGVEVNF